MSVGEGGKAENGVYDGLISVELPFLIPADATANSRKVLEASIAETISPKSLRNSLSTEQSIGLSEASKLFRLCDSVMCWGSATSAFPSTSHTGSQLFSLNSQSDVLLWVPIVGSNGSSSTGNEDLAALPSPLLEGSRFHLKPSRPADFVYHVPFTVSAAEGGGGDSLVPQQRGRSISEKGDLFAPSHFLSSASVASFSFNFQRDNADLPLVDEKGARPADHLVFQQALTSVDVPVSYTSLPLPSVSHMMFLDMLQEYLVGHKLISVAQWHLACQPIVAVKPFLKGLADDSTGTVEHRFLAVMRSLTYTIQSGPYQRLRIAFWLQPCLRHNSSSNTQEEDDEEKLLLDRYSSRHRSNDQFAIEKAPVQRVSSLSLRPYWHPPAIGERTPADVEEAWRSVRRLAVLQRFVFRLYRTSPIGVRLRDAHRMPDLHRILSQRVLTPHIPKCRVALYSDRIRRGALLWSSQLIEFVPTEHRPLFVPPWALPSSSSGRAEPDHTAVLPSDVQDPVSKVLLRHITTFDAVSRGYYTTEAFAEITRLVEGELTEVVNECLACATAAVDLNVDGQVPDSSRKRARESDDMQKEDNEEEEEEDRSSSSDDEEMIATDSDSEGPDNLMDDWDDD